MYGNETNKRVLRQEQRWQSILKHEGRGAYLWLSLYSHLNFLKCPFHWFLVHANPFTIFTVSSVSVINLLLTFIFLEHSLKISLALDWVTAYKIKSCVISSAHYLAFQTQVGVVQKMFYYISFLQDHFW